MGGGDEFDHDVSEEGRDNGIFYHGDSLAEI